ncbi:uncharacterized protein [Coffea arabica]|uniref:Uncharacterized protein n=1 Tax=Coffea arabica TaxID=13443 RepID=A0A6P6VJ95_COFAR
MLRSCLSKVISPCQSAFIPGHCITDNILIAYEINHSLKLKSCGQERSMSVKLDMSKAFDKEAERCGSISGFRIGSRGPTLSHLFFADDTLLFGKASLQEAQHIRTILDLYKAASGQEVNFDKSAVVFSKNTDPTVRRSITQLLNIMEVPTHDQYLGLPTVVGRSTSEVFSSVKERIWQKIHGWNEQRLSKAGKEIMIKAIVQAIPTYSMSCFKYPDSLLSDIQSMISNFWWGDGAKRKPIHWVSWDRMCLSTNDGGTGFRQLKAFNLALLAKQAWHIATQPSTFLHRVFKAKYFPTKDFFQDESTSRPSFTWRGLCAVRRYLLSGSKWRVGNGLHIKIWKDRWIPRPSIFKIVSPSDALPEDSTVDCLIDKDSGK